MAGEVFRLWCIYWESKSDKVPPLALVRGEANPELFFVSSATEPELKGFLDSVAKSHDYRFSEIGDWLVSPYEWFGHWTFFCAFKKDEIRTGRVRSK